MALSTKLARAIVSATDDIFDVDKIDNAIKNAATNLEKNLLLDSDIEDLAPVEDYMEQYIAHWARHGNDTRMPKELEETMISLDFDNDISNRLSHIVDGTLNGAPHSNFKSQYTADNEAPAFDENTDRAIYNYLLNRLNKHDQNEMLSEAGKEKVLNRAVASLKETPEFRKLRESMPDFDDLSTQMEKLPAPIANKEKALDDFLSQSVEKRPQYRGVSSLQDTEWDARFWMTNEIGPHVGTVGQANYFALKSLMNDGDFSQHMGLYQMGMEANALGESFERAGVYIKPEDHNKIYTLAKDVNNYLDAYLADLELDPNDLKAYTKLSLAETGQIDDAPKPRRRRGDTTPPPLTGWEEIIEQVATQYLGMVSKSDEGLQAYRDTVLPQYQIRAVAKMIGQMRGWGDNVYGSTVRPATIQKGYVDVRNPLKLGSDGVWKVETLFKDSPTLADLMWDDETLGIDRFVDAMAVQLNTGADTIKKSLPYIKLTQKAEMLEASSGDIDPSSLLQFEDQQVKSLEVAALHQEFKNFLQEYGFDSIQYVNQVEPSFTTDADNLSYILFKPEQWKAVSARRFDPNDKRFGAAEGGVIGFFSRLLSDQDEVARPERRTVERGDTLEKISRETGVSVDDLQKFNNIQDINRINAGQSLRLSEPVRKNQVVSNLASYLNPFAGDKTEKDYDTQVVSELKRAARNAIANGRMNIEYEDYRGANVRGQASSPEQREKDNFILRMATGKINPTEEAAFSVGGAQLLVEDGKLYATDIYDFSEIPFDKVKDIYSGARYLAGKIPGREFRSKIFLGPVDEYNLDSRARRQTGGVSNPLEYTNTLRNQVPLGPKYNDAGERLYYWVPSLEGANTFASTGTNDDRYRRLFGNQSRGGYFTEAEIRQAFEANEGMTTLSSQVDWENYWGYLTERQDLIDSGQLDTGLDAFVDGRQAKMQLIEDAGGLRKAGGAKQSGQGLRAIQTDAYRTSYANIVYGDTQQGLMEKYGIPQTLQLDDGSLYEFNGSSFTKTFAPDTQSFGEKLVDSAVGAAISAALPFPFDSAINAARPEIGGSSNQQAPDLGADIRPEPSVPAVDPDTPSGPAQPDTTDKPYPELEKIVSTSTPAPKEQIVPQGTLPSSNRERPTRRFAVAKGGKIDKKKMACNKPKRTPNHPKKSHVVKACKDGKEKIIRFGEQGAKTAGKPKAGESKRMKAKRKSFKARHRKNIKRGNMSAAYWADKVKW
jgi:LysM repeat protein